MVMTVVIDPPSAEISNWTLYPLCTESRRGAVPLNVMSIMR